MSEPFVGEIRMFAGNFAPRSWAFCDGQLLAVSQNDELFSLLGTIYGGDGRTTFGLPDMRGRIPLHAGTGSGLNNRRLGSRGGIENVTLTTNQIPSHTHVFNGMNTPATETAPGSATTLGQSQGYDLYVPAQNPTSMAAGAVSSIGASRQHSNLMPFLCVNFIIALFGIYPSRN